MPSHSWLLIVTVAVCATIVHATAIPTTEEKKPNVPIKKWSPNPRIPLADDPR